MDTECPNNSDLELMVTIVHHDEIATQHGAMELTIGTAHNNFAAIIWNCKEPPLWTQLPVFCHCNPCIPAIIATLLYTILFRTTSIALQTKLPDALSGQMINYSPILTRIVHSQGPGSCPTCNPTCILH